MARLYQRRDVATETDIGEPAALPKALRGFAHDVLADLDTGLGVAKAAQLGFAGLGFRVAAPTPAREQHIHKAVFLQRLTSDERIAIRIAAEGTEETPRDRLVQDFQDLLYASDLVDLDSANMILGLGYLVAVGLLAAERPDQLRG